MKNGLQLNSSNKRGVLFQILELSIFGILKLVTKILSPFEDFIAAGIHFARKRNLLFLNHWRAEYSNSELLVCQKSSETYVIYNSDTTIGSSIKQTGAFDFEKFERAVSLLPAGYVLDTIYDVGANIGTICIPAIKRGFAKKAYAFEPERNNYQLLAANIYLNGLQEKISHFNVALGAENDKVLIFELAPTNFGDHRVRTSAEKGAQDETSRRTVQVYAETFDKLIPNLDPKNSLFWIDVQGYEGHVFVGAQSVIQSKVPIVTEFWPYGLRRSGSIDSFMCTVSKYTHFIDLSDPETKLMPTGSFDSLFKKVDKDLNSTDLLLL